MDRPKVPPGSFPTVALTRVAFECIEGVIGAARLMETAATPEEIQAAYGTLNQMRKRLVTYVSALESYVIAHRGSETLHKEPHVFLRFD